MHFLLKVVSIFWLKVLFSEAPRRAPALGSELIALDASERGGSAPVCGVHRAGWGWPEGLGVLLLGRWRGGRARERACSCSGSRNKRFYCFWPGCFIHTYQTLYILRGTKSICPLYSNHTAVLLCKSCVVSRKSPGAQGK